MEKKTLLVCILAISLCPAALSFSEDPREEAKEEFQELKAEFEIEISYPPYSDYVYTNKYWDSESGRKIIAMGKSALLFVFEEVKNGKAYFTVAAERITGIRMKGPTAADLSRQWLEWWQENENNPEWNLFISSTVPDKGKKEAGE